MMKILWVEDFDGGKSRQVSKPLYLDYFNLNESHMIIKENLRKALEYIRNEPNSFDLILLDIDLKPQFNENKKGIYTAFFEGILTESFFDKHFTNNDGGILLYLYLRECVNFPKNKIAFLSAYVGDEDPLDRSGTGQYNYVDEDDFLSQGKGKMKKISDLGGGATGNTKENTQIFGIFEELGTPVTHLYQKPQSGTREGARKPVNAENFQKNFIQANETDYILFRRNVIEMSRLLMDTYVAVDDPDAPIETNVPSPIEKFVHILYASDETGKRLPTFFSTAKADNNIGKGTDIYTPEYFYSLLEKTLDLPLDPKLDEDRILLSYMRELFFCADCFAIPDPNNDTDRTPAFDLAAANVLIKARHGLSHGSGALLGSYQQAMLELKNFLVPLFFRLVFKIELLSEENKAEYLELERNLLLSGDTFDFVDHQVIFDTTQQKVLDLFEILCSNLTEMKTSEQRKKGNNILTSNVDTSVLRENSKTSFGQIFLTRFMPETRTLTNVGKAGECVIQISITNNLKDVAKDSLEELYIQKAYQLGFST